MIGELTRPIIGIENRTAQEVFDIMSARFRHSSANARLTALEQENKRLREALERKTQSDWSDNDLVKGKVYRTKTGHSLVYEGLDTFRGETTHQFAWLNRPYAPAKRYAKCGNSSGTPLNELLAPKVDQP